MLKKMAIKSIKFLLMVAAIFIISIAILLNMARITFSLFGQKRTFFENWASRILHQPVTIGKVSAGWHWFEPELTFDRVIMHSSSIHGSDIHIQKLSIGIYIISSLFHWKLLPAQLLISGIHLNIYQQRSGKLIVQGISGVSTQKNSVKDMLIWLITQADVSVRHANINWYINNETLIPIRDLRLKVMNRFLQHKMIGVAYLQQVIPTQFRFVLNLHQVDINNKNINAELYIQAKNVLLNQFTSIKSLRKLMHNIQITRGQCNVQFWADWEKGKLSRWQSVFAASHVGLLLPKVKNYKANKRLLIDGASAHLLWRRYSNGWGLQGDSIQLRLNGHNWPENYIGYRFIEAHDSQSPRYLLRAGFLHLQDVQDFAQEIGVWPHSWREFYSKVQPHGDLKNVNIEFWNSQKGAEFTIATQFSSLGFNSWNKIPGGSGLNGSLYYSPQSGSLRIKSQSVSLSLPYLINHVLSFDQLSLFFNWKKYRNGWHLRVKRFYVNDQNLMLTSDGEFTISAQGAPWLNLLVGFKIVNLKRLKHYVLNRLLRTHPDLVTWLDSAFKQGKIDSGTMIFHGPLHAFPFDHHRGRFEVVAHLENVTMVYHPEWPAMTNAYGDIVFDGRRMIVSNEHAFIAGNRLYSVQAIIPNLQNSILFVSGQAQSDLAKGLEFLQNSPLHLKNEISGMQLQGPMHLHLKLIIPLDKAIKLTPRSMGTVSVHDDVMKLPNWNIQLAHIKGQLYFDNNKLSANHISASVWGTPLAMQVATLTMPNTNSVVQVSIGGWVNMDVLRKYCQSTFMNYFNGSTQYRALINLKNGSNVEKNFSVISDLHGVSIHGLPLHYNKLADERRPLQLQINIRKKNRLLITTNYDNHISAALRFDKSKSNWYFVSGEIHLGGGLARIPELPGLIIDGHLSYFNWKQWQPFLISLLENNKIYHKFGLRNVLRFIELRLDRLNAFQHTLHSIYVKIFSRKNDWAFNMQNSQVAGILLIPHRHNNDWYGDFQYLYLPKIDWVQRKFFDSHTLPPLRMTIKDFHYANKKYGQIVLKTTPTNHGLIINRLSVRAPLFAINLSGLWQMQNQHVITSVVGNFFSKDLGALLSNRNITKKLVNGNGGANFNLYWNGSPSQIDVRTLNGVIKFNFSKGRIIQLGNNTEVELGFGRLLNLFSLQSFSRWIALDFSALSKKGFYFDRFKGDILLQKGSARVNKVYLLGPVANIAVRGEIGLVKKDYHLTLQVVPHLTSSLPFIVGIVGGPIAGVVTWAVNEVAGPGIDRAAGFVYRVTGTWKHPKIKKLTS